MKRILSIILFATYAILTNQSFAKTECEGNDPPASCASVDNAIRIENIDKFPDFLFFILPIFDDKILEVLNNSELSGSNMSALVAVKKNGPAIKLVSEWNEKWGDDNLNGLKKANILDVGFKYHAKIFCSSKFEAPGCHLPKSWMIKKITDVYDVASKGADKLELKIKSVEFTLSDGKIQVFPGDLIKTDADHPWKKK